MKGCKYVLSAQCYKTVFVCSLQIVVLSQSVFQTKLKKLARDKRSSLLRKLVNYGQKCFKTLAPDLVVNRRSRSPPVKSVLSKFIKTFCTFYRLIKEKMCKAKKLVSSQIRVRQNAQNFLKDLLQAILKNVLIFSKLGRFISTGKNV